jgi:hypothetical protein
MHGKVEMQHRTLPCSLERLLNKAADDQQQIRRLYNVLIRQKDFEVFLICISVVITKCFCKESIMFYCIKHACFQLVVIIPELKFDAIFFVS